MNENSKITKSETPTIFSENFSLKPKSAHFVLYDCLKLLSEAQCLIEESVDSAGFAFGFIKDILNGDFTREEALKILDKKYTSFLYIKADIKDYKDKINEFLEHFEF